jgi:teichuronic acid biosynthesis glycosyltransferase TuaG
MALVSIITPSWNVATLIGETIASVQAQTMRTGSC